MTLYKNWQNEPVTVCVPTYKHQDFIAECLESIFSQGLRKLTVIVSDDFSQDDTLKIVHQFKEKYPEQLIVIKNDENLGLERNVKNIYRHIPKSTKYISWFSGDDIMLPGKLAKQITFLRENPDFVMCYHNTIVRDYEKKFEYLYNDIWCGQKAYSGHITSELIKYGCFVCGLSVLMNYEKVKHISHNSKLGIYNDWAYFIEVSMEGKVGYLNQTLGVYRRHRGNITRHKLDSKGTTNILLHLRKKYIDHNDNINYALIRNYLSFSFKYLIARNFPDFFLYFKKAFQCGMRSRNGMLLLIKITALLFIQRVALFYKTRSIFR